ncbi:hypothetical protein [Amycolatopsis sp. CA-126428]|uniref:hypothetical protein n=1 Tax=Amycolatopsis sp. CA-126428 TaxID=2073158 RepID=UPI000CD19F85|nr:hypothetical protein [Amycolatopsis sp. CA-126428]
MSSVRYLVVDPDGTITYGLTATGGEFAKAIQENVGDVNVVERVPVDVDLAMYHCRQAAPSALVNLVAAVVVTAHWGRAPERYTGTVVFSGGGPTGQESASLGEETEEYVRGLAAFACRRSGLPGTRPK